MWFNLWASFSNHPLWYFKLTITVVNKIVKTYDWIAHHSTWNWSSPIILVNYHRMMKINHFYYRNNRGVVKQGPCTCRTKRYVSMLFRCQNHPNSTSNTILLSHDLTAHCTVVSIEFSPLSTVELTTNWYQLHNGDYREIQSMLIWMPIHNCM